MKNLFAAIVLFCTAHNYAQIIFEKGYFVSNDGNRTECLIENVDWKDNPVYFEYKLADADKPQRLGIADVQEFGIDNTSQYKRFSVNIERSNNARDTRQLPKSKTPVFKKEILFLKTLIQGEASLYVYSDDNFTKFFFETPNTAIEQLIHIKYMDAMEEYILENNFFRQQLSNNLACQSLTENDFKTLTYSSKALSKIFIKFNQCNGTHKEIVNYKDKVKRDSFDLRLQAGVYQASLDITDPNQVYNVSTDMSGTVFKFGVEAEYILPFNKGIWSVFIAPTYQSFKAENTFSRTDGFYILPSMINYSAKANLASIDVPIGFRRYFHIGKSSRIFANVAYSLNYDASTGQVAFTNTENNPSATVTMPISSRSNLAFGLGYSYKSIGLEFRFNLPRNLNGFSNWTASYTTYGLQMSYRLL